MNEPQNLAEANHDLTEALDALGRSVVNYFESFDDSGSRRMRMAQWKYYQAHKKMQDFLK